MSHRRTARKTAAETFSNTRSFSATMLLDRDYKWCAETMLKKHGLRALGRAERRARCKTRTPAGTISGSG
jgi:hypothetical protein